MDSTTSAAHRRVGAAAVLAFLALLLLGLAHNAAQADPVVPAATPAATPSVEPAQPLPRQSPVPRLDHPGDGDGGFGHRGDGDGDRGGFGGGRQPGGGGGGTAPAPSTGGSTGGSQT